MNVPVSITIKPIMRIVLSFKLLMDCTPSRHAFGAKKGKIPSMIKTKHEAINSVSHIQSSESATTKKLEKSSFRNDNTARSFFNASWVNSAQEKPLSTITF